MYPYVADLQGPEFSEEVLRRFGISYEVPPEQLANIPTEGGFLTVSNHPFGGADGLILNAIINPLRPDFKILTTFLLAQVRNLTKWFIPVDNFSTGGAKSIRGIRSALGHIGSGGSLGLFPTGEVSTYQKKGRRTAVSDKRIIEDKPWPENITYDKFARATYTLCSRSSDGTVQRQTITLGVPGEHNVYNSMAAAAAADYLGIDRAHTAAALKGYTGTERRFQILGTRNGFTVIDDYAHHPTEIEATLRTALNYPHRELWCVFQSHTYTRTKALMDEFARALTLADHVILAKIYPARETDNLGISSHTLADRIRQLGHPCLCMDSFEEIEDYLLQNCQSDDLVITMGAGNIDEVGHNLVS